MKRSLFKGSFLVVEGSTDGRLYKKFTDRHECEIIVAHCKENVRIAVREMVRRNDEHIIGIIDSDTDRIRGVVHRPPIFSTDCRDSEMLMMHSEAFDSVLAEYGEDEKIERFTSRFGDIREALLASCYPLGLLMYISDLKDHKLSFKDLDHASFTDRRTLKPLIKEMISAVVSNSPNSYVGRDALIWELEEEYRKKRDPWDVCRGHDMVAVFAIGLRDIFGEYNSRYIKSNELAGALRLAYDREAFHGTRLYKESAAWCADRHIRVWIS
jgi:hypothetical protein